MRKYVLPVVIVALVGLTASVIQAQQGRAELRGSVTDDTGGALPGVAVVVTNQENGTFREYITSGEGSFFAAQLTPGTFTITAELPGFRGFERTDFAIGVGTTLDIDIVLEIGALEETITVSGESPLVDLTSAEVGGTINTGDLTELPVGNRSYFSAISTLPGIVFRPSASLGNDTMVANGQTPGTNSVAVDGASNNDDSSGTWAGGQTRVPLESVSEFQVVTNQFDAEFGRARGAVINSITKQGTNAVTGVLFDYYTSDAMTQKDYFVAQNPDLTKPANNKQEFGGVIGGPIVRDRMHFFVSVERQIVNPSRSRIYETRPDLSFSLSEKWRAWNTLYRVDNQINANHTWAFRWLREIAPQYNLVGNRSATLNTIQDETDSDQTSVGSYTAVYGNNKVNTLRFSHTREQWWRGNPCWRETLDQTQCPPQFNFNSFQDNQLSGSTGNADRNYILSNNFSWFIPEMAGDHDFKFGVTYHNTWMQRGVESNLNGTFSFNTDMVFDSTNPYTYPERLSIRVGGPDLPTNRFHTLEAYFQDKWQVNDRLTIGLGARYDYENFPLENPDNPFMAVNTYPIDGNNFSPRTSFAYDASGDGSSVIRGGYGIFYDKVLGYAIDDFVLYTKFTDSFITNFPLDQVDPGPAAGMFPTDPFLLSYGSAADCPANPGGDCPYVDRAALNAAFPLGVSQRSTGTVVFDNPNRKQPYTHQMTVGYERELASTVSLSVDFVRMLGRDLFLRHNMNPFSRAGTGRTDPVTRMPYGILNDTYAGNVWTPESVGTSTFHAMNVMLEKRYANNYAMRVSYSLSKADTDAVYFTSANWAQVGTVMNQDQLWGPSPFTRLHNLTISGRTVLPGGMTVSGVARYMGGEPFQITNSAIDGNMNGIGPDPSPAGSYSGSGTNSITVNNAGGANGAIGPDFVQLDVRLGYRVRPGTGNTLDIFFDIFNITNRANFNNPSGDERLSNFLILRSLRGGSGFPRAAQFGVRFGF